MNSIYIKLSAICILFLSLHGNIKAGAGSNDAVPIEWREAFVTVEVNMKQIDGVEGRFLGIMEQRGFAFYEHGEVATVDVWLTFERRGPATDYTGYAVYKFADGATKVGRFSGEGDPRGEQEGEFVFDGGTGRYEGITGEGTFVGQGYPPHGDIYLDVKGTYVVP